MHVCIHYLYKFPQGLFWPSIFIFILFFMGLSILAGENLLYSVDLKYLSGVLSTYLPTMGDHESQEIFQLGKQRQRCDAAYLS